MAQRCDMLRHTKTRSETFKPKLQPFVTRDFVYLKRQKVDRDFLDSRVGRLLLKVKSVGKEGRLVLEGRMTPRRASGITWRTVLLVTSPGYLDVWQNPKLACGDVDHSCQVCHLTIGGSTMLLCSGCDEGWQRACQDPPLLTMPVEDRFCPRCSQGVQDLVRIAFFAS
jgi:hypothetical protein